MSPRLRGWLWVLVFCVTMPAGVVVSTQLARRSFEKVKLREQTIYVKGYAERPITSDRASWRGQVTQRQPLLADAYRKLEIDRARVLAVLATGGFPAEQVDVDPVEIEAVYAKDEKGNRTNTIESYAVRQRLAVWSPDVQRVATLARAVSPLIGDGIEIAAEPPTYLYTKLDDLKLAMLSDASANARDRATRMVEGTGSRLGPVRSASQGVFQITPAFSTEVSGGGENDTTSIGKLIKAVVTVEFAIE